MTKVESVIPSKTDEELLAPVSPAVQALRDELGIQQEVFRIIGNATIKASENKMAAKVLDYLQAGITLNENKLQSQLMSEELGRPMSVDGTVVSLAAGE